MMRLPENLQKLPHDGEFTALGQNVGKYPRHDYEYPSMDSSLPIRVDFVGDDDMRGPCFRHFCNRPLFSIEYVYSGNVEFQQDGRHYPVVGPGEVFFFHRERETSMAVGPAGFCRKLALSISGPLVDAMLHETGLTSIDVMAGGGAIESLLRETWDLAKQRPVPSPALSANACRILFELSQHIKSPQFPPAVQTGLALIEERLHSSLTQAELCRHCCTSPTTLLRLFRKHIGCPPIDYYLRRKAEAAGHLLQCSEFSIKEIAGKMGYSNQLYFSSEFRKRMGVSPTEFRRGHQ